MAISPGTQKKNIFQTSTRHVERDRFPAGCDQHRIGRDRLAIREPDDTLDYVALGHQSLYSLDFVLLVELLRAKRHVLRLDLAAQIRLAAAWTVVRNPVLRADHDD